MGYEVEIRFKSGSRTHRYFDTWEEAIAYAQNEAKAVGISRVLIIGSDRTWEVLPDGTIMQ